MKPPDTAANPLWDRRQFLVALGASIGPLPWALARFADDRPDGVEVLSTSLARARSVGKPLLVLLVPGDGTEWAARRERGYDLAAWLMEMSDASLCQLSLCEVGTATSGELSKVIGRADVGPAGSASADTPDAWAVLVETGGGKFERRPIRALKNSWRETWAPDVGETKEDFKVRQEAARLHQWREMSAAVAEVLIPDGDRLLARSRQALEAHPDSMRDEIDRALAGTAEIDPALADSAAAYLWQVSADLPEKRRSSVDRALLAAARFRVGLKSPGGTWWGTAGPCGAVTLEAYPEKERRLSYPCGTGHTPYMGQRFLYFYTKEPAAYSGL